MSGLSYTQLEFDYIRGFINLLRPEAHRMCYTGSCSHQHVLRRSNPPRPDRQCSDPSVRRPGRRRTSLRDHRLLPPRNHLLSLTLWVCDSWKIGKSGYARDKTSRYVCSHKGHYPGFSFLSGQVFSLDRQPLAFLLLQYAFLSQFIL